MDISRRFFLGGAIAVVAAQTFKPSFASNMPTIYGNWRDDDSAGFNALFANEPVIFKKEQIGVEGYESLIIFKGRFKIDKTIEISKRTKLKVEGSFEVNAKDLPSGMPLIFYHPDATDLSVMDNRILLTMQEKREVPLFQYDWKDPNFNGKDYIHYGRQESYTSGKLENTNIEFNK